MWILILNGDIMCKATRGLWHESVKHVQQQRAQTLVYLCKHCSNSQSNNYQGHDPGGKLHGKQAPVDALAPATLSQPNPNNGASDALAAGHWQAIPVMAGLCISAVLQSS